METAGVVDGLLDCVDEQRWDVESTIDRGTMTHASAKAAVNAALLEYALEDQLRVDGTVGTVVLEGREVIRGTATELSDGRWVPASLQGCSADGQPDSPVGRLGSPCPTTGTGAVLTADVVHFGGRTYTAIDQEWPVSELGEVVAITRCRLQVPTDLHNGSRGTWRVRVCRESAFMIYVTPRQPRPSRLAYTQRSCRSILGTPASPRP